jgi:hypothetical protein
MLSATLNLVYLTSFLLLGPIYHSAFSFASLAFLASLASLIYCLSMIFSSGKDEWQCGSTFYCFDEVVVLVDEVSLGRMSK